MKVFSSVSELQDYLYYLCQKRNLEQKSIGFVPTMGFLHEGHLSLVYRAKTENDITVVSIFVNPIQFGKNEDFDAYPCDIERDRHMLEQACVDVLFIPSVEEIYPAGGAFQELCFKRTDFSVPLQHLTSCLCAVFRPGHFEGVIQVVYRLFYIVKPDRAYFGYKDYQQFLVVRQMVYDLGLSVKVIGCPTVRDKDGLALSSRNSYLSQDERVRSLAIFKALSNVKDLYNQGERNNAKLEHILEHAFKTDPGFVLDYAVVRRACDLDFSRSESDRLIALVALRIGKTRLIDNMLL